MEMAVTDLAGVPPIKVYKIGDVYFVNDGNHRRYFPDRTEADLSSLILNRSLR